MTQTVTLESAIHQELTRIGTCTLEELNERLPYVSWNQVFSTVDRLTRKGTVTLQRPDSLGDIVSSHTIQSCVRSLLHSRQQGVIAVN